MSQNGPTYIIWNLTKNGSLLPKITHICGKETKFQNRIDTPDLKIYSKEKLLKHIFYFKKEKSKELQYVLEFWASKQVSNTADCSNQVGCMADQGSGIRTWQQYYLIRPFPRYLIKVGLWGGVRGLVVRVVSWSWSVYVRRM